MNLNVIDTLCEWVDDGRGARLICKEGKFESFTLLHIGYKDSTKRYECTIKLFETETTIYNSNKTKLKQELVKIVSTAPIDYLTGRMVL